MEDKGIMQGLDLLLEYQEACIINAQRLLGLAEKLHDFIEQSEYRPPYDSSLLDIIGGVTEPLTSRIIANIFKYRDENKKFSLLEAFISRFIKDGMEIKHPVVTAEKERWDVAVRDRRLAIIIENKLKNADFQRNQIARYIARMKRDYHYAEENIYIVLMPQYADTKIRVSAGRLPKDWVKPNGIRTCRVNDYECWCDFPDNILDRSKLEWCAKCDKDIFSRLSDNTVVLHDDFAEWLLRESKSLPPGQWPLRSCMEQFAYYIKGLFSTRYNSKLNMAITAFIKDKILSNESPKENWSAIEETLAELKDLNKAVEGLRKVVAKEYIKKWTECLQKDYPELRTENKNDIVSFGINIKGVWVGCWAGDNPNHGEQPYWGFFCHKEPIQEQIEMVDHIVSVCEVENGKREGKFILWGNTLHGDDRCRAFYRVAKELKYL